MVDHRITEGMSIIYKKEVNLSDTAGNFGSGVLDFLLSTPAVVSMAIEASIKLLDSLVPEGYITAGLNINISHEKPTLLGEKLNVILTVSKVVGDLINLDVVVHDQVGVIAKGTHQRIVAKSENLVEAAYNRLGREI